MGLVQCLQEVPDLHSEHALHRRALAPEHMDFDVSSTEGCRNLHPNEACADDDDALGRRSLRSDRPPVRERAQIMNLVSRRAGDGEANRFGTRRKEQRAKLEVLTIRQCQTFLTHIERGYARVEQKIDVIVGIELRRPHRHPLFWCTTGEEILGEIRTVIRWRIICADHR
jgi:hypothetical protein